MRDGSGGGGSRGEADDACAGYCAMRMEIGHTIDPVKDESTWF